MNRSRPAACRRIVAICCAAFLATTLAATLAACGGAIRNLAGRTTTTTAGPPTSSVAATTGAGSATTAPTAGSAPAAATYDPYAGTKPATTPAGRTRVGTLRTADGTTRDYRLYIPSSLPAGTPAPLLVALHGGLGKAEQFEANSGFDSLAEANGFYVVYPDGIGILPNGAAARSWNGGRCCGHAANTNVDDVGFIRQLLDTLDTEYRIDPNRTYAAGHSNGAVLSYRLACELSDRIVAIGLQAGSLEIDSCNPTRPVSVFALHGTDDTNIPINGGRGSGVSGVAFRPPRAAVETLARADVCPPHAIPGTDPTNPDLTVSTWTPCRNATAVRFVVVTGGTHAWMGHPATTPLASHMVGDPYLKLDASRAIWSFLAAHPRT